MADDHSTGTPGPGRGRESAVCDNERRNRGNAGQRMRDAATRRLNSQAVMPVKRLNARSKLRRL